MKMGTLGACSNFYNEENSFDDHTAYEVKKDEKGPSFETLTTADINALMNEYIENVQSIVGVSWARFRSVEIFQELPWFILTKLVAANNHSDLARPHKVG